MKILLLAIVLTCIATAGFSQELRKITKKDRNSPVIEEYYVFRKERDVKHGQYVKMYESGELVETGFYKKNLKDSLWISYARNGEDTLTFGSYKNDRRVGPWVINNSDGTLDYEYNFTTKKIGRYNWRGQSNRFQVLTEGRWVEQEIDNPPMMLDGNDPIKIIARNIEYPIRAWRGGIDGEVVVSFVVDSLGRMGSINLKKTVDPDLDKEALRIFKTVDFDWHPAQKDDKYITVRYSLPVTFILRK
jgi:TonB family protein